MKFLKWIPGQGREWTKDIWSIATPLPMKNSLKEIPVEAQKNAKQYFPEKCVTDSRTKSR